MLVTTSNSAPLANPDKFFIGGRWIAPLTNAKFDVISASTEELLFQIAEAQAGDINAAVMAAREAFDRGPWPRISHTERATYLRRIAELVATRADDLAKIWTGEVGVTHGLAQMTAQGVPAAYEYYASLADSFPFEEQHKPRAGGNFGLLVREPVGVVGAIIPWNGPMLMIAYKLAPALLSGCTVILKASPEAPGEAYVMAEICEAAGLPKGVVNVVTADRAVSELLVRHPGVDKISFTGSSAAGKKIGAICAERVARCTLELGGKSAAVVLDDYDVEAAAQSISGSARLVTGQICAALTRIIVTRKHHDALVDALSANFGSIKVGDPFKRSTEMGPLATARQRDRVEGYIAKGIAEGARVSTGGGRPMALSRGFFVEPTVFYNVDNAMTIAREEIFGPVISVIPADNDRQAIDIANDSDFGLNASIFTNDPQRAYQASRELKSGTVGHNSFRLDLSIAFGGFKQSGIGREGGVEGLRPFLETKTVILDGKPDHLQS